MTATDAFYVRGHGAVPEIDPAAWRLRVHGLVERELDLSLDDPARGVPGARGDRDAAVRRQPARGPDRHPRHPGRGAVGSGRDRHRDVDRRRARRRARARRPAARGRARRLRGRRPLPGGEAGPALRWLDPARQGVPPRGPARLGDERRAAPARPRRAAARGRARLHRRAQRQVARADRGPLDARGRATSSTSSTGCCPRTGRRAPARGCRSAWSRSTPTCCLRPTARRSRPARSRCAATRSRAASGTSRGSTSRSTAARRWSQAELLDDLGRWAWRHWRITVDLAPGEHEILVRAWDSSAATQPEDEAALWNPKGYVNNARPRVRVRAPGARRLTHCVAWRIAPARWRKTPLPAGRRRAHPAGHD